MTAAAASRRAAPWAVALIAIWMAALAGARPLNVPDEGRYAEVAREMLVTGDFVTPRLNGVPFLDKPPLFYWLEAASFAALGVHPFSARLVPALLGALGCALLLLAGGRLHGGRAGLLGALVLAANPYYFGASQYVNHDLAVAVLVSAALLAFAVGLVDERPGRGLWVVGGCAAAGLAVLTKGLIGVLFPFGIAGLWVVLTRRWSRVPWGALGLGLLLLAALVLPWVIAVRAANPDFLHYFVVVQHFQRYAGGGFNNPMGPAFYVVLVGVGLLPWTPQLPSALRRAALAFRGNRADPEARLLLVLWPAAVLIFFSIPRSKIAGYALPALPPLALLLGAWWDEALRRKGSPRAVAVSGGVTAAFGLLLVGAPPLLSGRAAVPGPAAARLAATGLLALAAAAVVLRAHRRGDLRRALAGQVAFAAILGSGAILAVPHLIRDGTGPLADRMRPALRAGDRVVCYRRYFYDLPLHLGLREPLVVADDWGDPRIAEQDNWRRELWLGLRRRPEAAAWMVTPARFREMCGARDRCFVVARRTDAAELESAGLVPLGEWGGAMLLATPAAAGGFAEAPRAPSALRAAMGVPARRERAAVEGLADDVGRAALDLVEDTPQVLADDPEREQLDAGEEHDADHDGRVAGHGDVVDQLLEDHPGAVPERQRRDGGARERQSPERQVGEGGEPRHGEPQQPAVGVGGAPRHARPHLELEGAAPEADPGVQPLHESGPLREALQGLDHPAVEESEVPGPGRDLDACPQGEEAVEEGSSEALRERLVSPVRSHAVDHVVPVAPALEHPVEQVERVLPVCVEDHHHLAARNLQAGAERSLLAEVPGELQVVDVADLGDAEDLLARGVSAAVVHHHDLEAVAQGGQAGRERGQEGAGVLGLVVHGHDRRDRGRRAPRRGG